MNVRSLILVVVAITIAGVAALLARNLMSGQPTQQVAAAPVKSADTQVLVAAVALPAGKLIEAKDFRWQSWPDNNTDGYFVQGAADPNSMAGKVVRVGVSAGQPVTAGNLVGPGEQGFLAAILSPGMRAVTVSVTDTSGVAGFVFPGDRVDLIMTQEIDTGDGPSRKSAETILRNVRVLAADQSTNDQDNMPKLVRTVTLEVTPKLVEYVSVMSRLGQLSLSLRPLAKVETKVGAKTEPGANGTPLNQEQPAQLADPDMPTADFSTVTMDRDVSKALSMVKYVRGAGGGGSAPAYSGPPMGMPAPVATAPAPKPAGSQVMVVRGSEASSMPSGGEK